MLQIRKLDHHQLNQFSKPTNIFPINHPTFFLRSIDADDFTFNNFYKKNIFLRIKNKIQKNIKI